MPIGKQIQKKEDNMLEKKKKEKSKLESEGKGKA
jgi:hypothetical protein